MKKNCLLIISRFPNPPHSGYKVKTFHLVKILSQMFRLHIVIVTDEIQESDSSSFLEQHSESYSVYCFPKWRCYFNALLSLLFSKKPLQAGYYQFRKVKKEIRKLSPSMDIIIPSLVRTTDYVDPRWMKPDALCILDLVDSYALSYARSKENTRSIFWKMIYGIEYSRLYRYERNQIKQSDATLLVNRSESEYWSAYGPCFYLPNGVHKHLFDYPTPEEELNALAFFGKMDYPPNVDAVKWFLNHVFEHLDKNVEFYIVGISPSPEIYRVAASNSRIHVTGFMDDPYSILSRCKAIISPMKTGGGIQNKVLETMALGKVNILSSLAADPIGAVPGTHYLVADNTQDYVNHISMIISDDTFKKRIENNARDFIRQNYSWEKYGEDLDKIINSVGKK